MTVTVASIILIVIFACVGLFSVVAAIVSWDCFFQSPNVHILTGKLSRGKARMVYLIIGIAILAMAVYYVCKI